MNVRTTLQGWSYVLATFNTRLSPKLLFEILSENPVSILITESNPDAVESHERISTAQGIRMPSSANIPRDELIRLFYEQGRLRHLPAGYGPTLEQLSRFEAARRTRGVQSIFGERTYINGFDVTGPLSHGSLTNTACTRTSALVSDSSSVRAANEGTEQGRPGRNRYVGILQHMRRTSRRSSSISSRRQNSSGYPSAPSTVPRRPSSWRSTTAPTVARSSGASRLFRPNLQSQGVVETSSDSDSTTRRRSSNDVFLSRQKDLQN